VTVGARDSDSEVFAREARFGVRRLDAAFGKTFRLAVAFRSHRVTESGVVLELRTAAAVVSQLNRHQCDYRTPGENTRRVGRDQVAEQNSDRLRQSQGCLVKGHA